MNKSRLPQAGKPAVLQQVQKSMAAFGRSLQCSLAIADLAKHIGGANQKDALTKEQLKELIQVIGTLGTEAALPILPKFDRQGALFKTEKKRLREGVIAGIEPHEVQAILREAPLFSEGLWSKTSFMEAEKLALERQQVSRFPVEERAISRKRAATVAVPAGLPPKKKFHPTLPPNPGFKPTKSVYIPQPLATSSMAKHFHNKPFRNPPQPANAQQPKAQQPQAQPAKTQQARAEQGAKKRKANSLATASRVNFKKPKVNVIPKPFAPSTSSSAGNTSSAPNPRKR